MKRVVIFLLVAVMVFGMVGCGEPKPNDKYSESAIAAMEAAIETADAFLSYELDAEEAQDNLDCIEEPIDTSDTYGLFAYASISGLGIRIGMYDRQPNSENWQGVKDARDSLYDDLYS